jgi:error-prone DNA polymerase
LHAHSSFSFLDGASSPEELAEEAERLGLHALAITDHDGFYGIVRFAEAAEHLQLKTIFGAELSLELPGPQNGEGRPPSVRTCWCSPRGEEGYTTASPGRSPTHSCRVPRKAVRSTRLDELADQGRDHWAVLTGCRKGTVRRAPRRTEGADAAAGELDRLVDLFGRATPCTSNSFDHGNPLDTRDNDLLAELARERGLPLLATNNVHYAVPRRQLLAAAVAAVRAKPRTRRTRRVVALARRSPTCGQGPRWLNGSCGIPMRSPAPSHSPTSSPSLCGGRSRPSPNRRCPTGNTPMSWLRHLVWQAVPRKYPDLSEKDRTRIEKELGVIEMKDFPGYFLIVYGIVQEARRRGILCQGRGSAANSAICYLLDITAVDAIAYDLPFERFLSSLRDEEPDIDVDFDSDRREEIIQWVYGEYGRDRAAQVAKRHPVPARRTPYATWRKRSAIRPDSRMPGPKQVEGLGSAPRDRAGPRHPRPGARVRR